MVGSFFEAHLFRIMQDGEECDYDHTLIDDFSAQGGDKEYCSVGENHSNMCKDVVIERALMQSQGEMIYMKMSSSIVSFNFDMPWMFWLMNLKILNCPLSLMQSGLCKGRGV